MREKAGGACLRICPGIVTSHCHSHCSLLLWRLVCTRQACCLFARVALLLLPLSLFLGVRAPSLSLAGFMVKAKAVRRGSLSFSLFVVASAACVYETGLLLVCAYRTSAASVEHLPRGSRAVAFPRWLQVLSCSTWLIVCSLLHQLFLLCFGFVGANSNSMNSISRAASSGR